LVTDWQPVPNTGATLQRQVGDTLLALEICNVVVDNGNDFHARTLFWTDRQRTVTLTDFVEDAPRYADKLLTKSVLKEHDNTPYPSFVLLTVRWKLDVQLVSHDRTTPLDA
jgi:hypothetical protein